MMITQTQINKLQGYSESRYKDRCEKVMQRIEHNQTIKDIQEEFKYWSDEFDSALNEVYILRQMRGNK